MFKIKKIYLKNLIFVINMITYVNKIQVYLITYIFIFIKKNEFYFYGITFETMILLPLYILIKNINENVLSFQQCLIHFFHNARLKYTMSIINA